MNFGNDSSLPPFFIMNLTVAELAICHENLHHCLCHRGWSTEVAANISTIQVPQGIGHILGHYLVIWKDGYELITMRWEEQVFASQGIDLLHFIAGSSCLLESCDPVMKY